MHRTALCLLPVVIVAAAFAPCAFSQETRILFLNKSEGFEHSPIAMKDGVSYAGKILAKLASENDATIKETKDASLINAENLKNYDLVILYTQGDLTKPSKDGGAPMDPKGIDALLQWVKDGGAIMGYHSATDTLRVSSDGQATPYIKMMGAEFRTHGDQFEGTVKVVDPTHPAMKSIPQDWKLMEEWYAFANFNKESMHVMALLDPGAAREKQEKIYGGPDYPIIWCSAYGKGKVYFNALGHREDVWDNPLFQKSIVDAAEWVLDKDNMNPAYTKPNYDEVVPKDEPKK